MQILNVVRGVARGQEEKHLRLPKLGHGKVGLWERSWQSPEASSLKTAGKCFSSGENESAGIYVSSGKNI